jgi:hypothetical protein
MQSQTSDFDWGTLKPAYNAMTGQQDTSSVPAGYTETYATRPSAAPATNLRGNAGGHYETVTGPGARGVSISQQWVPDQPATAAAQPELALKDASGKLYFKGDKTPVTTQVATGQTTGGFDDAFYNKYKQSILDYYMPQVDKQYGQSKDELTYRLARSGILDSSQANTDVANLADQYNINKANVYNQADTATGDLKSQVAAERQKATNQLYSTEDPEVAANTALSSVRDISLKQPDLSPIGAIFDIASVGGANVLKGYNAQKFANTYNTALASGGSPGARGQKTV